MATNEGAQRVLCLRPEQDFKDLGVAVPASLDVTFAKDENAIDEIGADVACLVLPSAGAHLAPELFRNASGLRLVQYTGMGFDRVPAEVIDGLDCAVANVPGASAPDVAAYVILVGGALWRQLLVGDELVKDGRYGEARSALAPARVRGFRGLRVGIVGFGGIGIEVARLFSAFGAHVRWFDPMPVNRPEIELYESASLDELLGWSELLTVHVPLTEGTRGLIGTNELARMQPGAVVVNAARGGIINEAALIEALDAGTLGGVALDVYEEEPLPPTSPILAAAKRHSGRVILSPHIAGVTPEASRELFVRTWANVETVIDGGEPVSRVR